MENPENIKNAMIKDVEEQMDAVAADYIAYTDASYNEKLKTLSPGATVPESGIFYDQINKDLYNEAVRKHKVVAMDAVAKYRSALAKSATQEPTSGAVNAVQLFLLLDPDMIPTVDFRTRVDDMLERYPDMLSYEAIRGFAAKHGYRIPPHPEAALRDGAGAVEKEVERFFDNCIVNSIEWKNGTVGDSPRAFIKMAIENYSEGRDLFSSLNTENR